MVRAQEGEQLIMIKPLYYYSVAVFLCHTIRNVDLGRLGCGDVFEKCTSDVYCDGLPLSMNVEVWSSKEGKGYEYSEGKLDDEFDDSQSLHYWQLAGNDSPIKLVF